MYAHKEVRKLKCCHYKLIKIIIVRYFTTTYKVCDRHVLHSKGCAVRLINVLDNKIATRAEILFFRASLCLYLYSPDNSLVL